MKKILILSLLSLSLLSLGDLLVNPSESKVINKKESKEELNKKLIEAIQNNNIELVKELISKGANVNYFNSKPYKASSVLMIASINENKKIVELLISKGADVNASTNIKGFKGYTALMFSSEFGYTEIVKLLISKGAKIDASISEGIEKGYTSLIFASENGNKDIVDLLIKNGADVNSKVSSFCDKDYTALMYASQSNYTEIVDLLVKNGADPIPEKYIDIINKKSDEKRKELIRPNIHSIQTFIETYAVDWNMYYPENIEELEIEAKNKNYWKEIINPFTGKSGLGKDGSFIDYKNYKPNLSLKGLVLYEPIDCRLNEKEKKTLCKSYKIYGTDQYGELLK